MFTLEHRDDVAVIVLDMPGGSTNTLRTEFTDELEGLLDEVEDDRDVTGVVIASGKPDSFIEGADIAMFSEVETADDGAALARVGQRVFERIEASSTPIVVAIHGACMGGGLELALACHGRIASDHPATRLGLPEVRLGLIPGSGGTQRLPRLVGLERALELILTGKDISASRARRMGLVDQVVHQAVLVDVASERARTLAAVDRTRGARHRDLVGRVRGTVMEDNPAGRAVLFRQAEANVHVRTHGNLPGPLRAIDVVRTGIEQGPRAGYAAEAQAFGELIVTPQARNLIRVFDMRQALRREARAAQERAVDVRKVAVVGAGLMGAGIAAVTAGRAELPVRLKDLDRDALRRGLRSVRDYLDQRVTRRRISAHDRDRLLSLVRPDTEYRGFGRVGLVIEAVVEDLAIKHRVCKEVAAVTGPDTVLASNTSSIPIDSIAEGHPDPARIVGMHYFSPVPRVPLLEVVEGPRTADWVTATAVDVGRRQGMTVVVVGDGPGLYTSRILGPYINEAAYLLTDGATVDAIDDALETLGFPVGPFRLVDEVGIDVAAKIARVLADGLGSRLTPAPGIEAIVRDGRKGRKNGRGFYHYDTDNGQTTRGDVDPSIYQLVTRSARPAPDADEMVDRALLAMVNEAVWTLGDGVLRTTRDGDAAAVFGLGFPPHLGGPLRYVDDRGPAAVVDRLRMLAADHGERFTPAPLLVEVAERGGRLTSDRTQS
ncbi:MAG: fatty acid oxidation complex subunit alpha FadJ [Actinobacteria bacterium]|nr:fatty acid oxidation complex subunit alpha FadJ [Actinomycetota bacterium]